MALQPRIESTATPDRSGLRRVAACVSVLLALAAAGPVAAQDQGLDSLLFAPLAVGADENANVQARSVQLYRLQLSLRLRRREEGRWGLRLTFPVSLSAVRIEGASDIGRFVNSLGIVSIVPGIELEIPVGEGARLRPFVEAGLGKGTRGGDLEVLYGVGLRASVAHTVGRAHLTFGGSAMRRRRARRIEEYEGYSTFEGALDAQVPLGFSIREREARGGIYFIARGFDGLEVKREGQEPIRMRGQFEVGASFSTAPDLRVWKIRLPWIAVGYQSGAVISGFRFYTTFPF